MNLPKENPPAGPASLSFAQRFAFVWAWLFRGLFDGELAARLRSAQLEYDRLTGRLPPALAEAPERPSLPPAGAAGAAAQTEPQRAVLAETRRAAACSLLGVLQREGRLIDFVKQDIASFSDADIGAAARLVHAGCRKTLAEHASIRAVVDQPEGSSLRLEPGYEVAAYKLTGQVTGSAPYTGVLRHKGWRVDQLQLPEPVAGADNSVLMPAEVEL